MSNCTMGLFWETIVDPITSEKSNRFLQNNLIVQFNITVGGGRGAGTRKIRGREGYGRREKKGREAGSGKREAGENFKKASFRSLLLLIIQSKKRT